MADEKNLSGEQLAITPDSDPNTFAKKSKKLNIKVLFAVLLILSVSAWYVNTKLNEPQSGMRLPVFNEEALEREENIDILIMGVDARDEESGGRSDTMMLLSIHPKENKVALISIPRDTLVKDATGNNIKINALIFLEGTESACRAVSELLHINVEHYIAIDFDGFAAVVDLLGGIDMDIPAHMYHWDPDPEFQIDIPAGPQHLNGQQALSYVRFRGTPTADIGRVQRQQEFLKAFFDQLKQKKAMTKLPALASEFYKYVETDMSLKDIANLAVKAKDFGSEDLITATLPGFNVYDPRAGACWEADPDIAVRLMEALFAGETFPTMIDDPSDYAFDGLAQSHSNVSSSTLSSDTQDLAANTEGEIDFLGEDGDEALL